MQYITLQYITNCQVAGRVLLSLALNDMRAFFTFLLAQEVRVWLSCALPKLELGRSTSCKGMYLQACTAAVILMHSA